MAATIFDCARKGDDLERITNYVSTGDVMAFEPNSGFSLCHCATYAPTCDVLAALSQHAEYTALATLPDTQDGATPLHTLCRRFASPAAAILDPALFSSFFDRLTKAGASVHTRDRFSRTPLHVLCTASHPVAPLISILADFGADINATNGSGWTPLHYAAAADNEVSVTALRQLGADTSVRNSAGDTAAAVARKDSRASKALKAADDGDASHPRGDSVADRMEAEEAAVATQPTAATADTKEAASLC